MKAALRGMQAWALQRASAVIVLALVLYFLLHLAVAPPASRAEWRAWVHGPAISITLLLLFGAIALHAWVGMRDIILDYVKPLGVRLLALLLLALWLITTVVSVAAVLYGAH